MALSFSDPELLASLNQSADADLDSLDFGVIGFDALAVVRRFNRFEAEAADLLPRRVLGRPLFTVVAPCMNNFLVAQRFEDAAALGVPLDAVIDYVLTLRMRPTKVKLRLLAMHSLPAMPAEATRYVLVQRVDLLTSAGGAA